MLLAEHTSNGQCFLGVTCGRQVLLGQAAKRERSATEGIKGIALREGR